MWPGGFLPLFNRQALGGGSDEFPITRRFGFPINTQLGWALAIAAGAAGMRLPQLGAAACGTHIGNGIVHVAVSADQRPYTPGLATSLAFLLPLGLGGLGSIARHPQGGTRQAAVGAAVGLATGLASFVGLRLRAARGR